MKTKEGKSMEKAAEEYVKKHKLFSRTDKAFIAGAMSPEAARHHQSPVWVSVKDAGYPEHNKGVLVFIPDEDYHITSGMWDVDNKWVLLDEYRVPECEVTYWMKVPSVPDEYKKEIEESFRVMKWLQQGIKSGEIKPEHPSSLTGQKDQCPEIDHSPVVVHEIITDAADYDRMLEQRDREIQRLKQIIKEMKDKHNL